MNDILQERIHRHYLLTREIEHFFRTLVIDNILTHIDVKSLRDSNVNNQIDVHPFTFLLTCIGENAVAYFMST